MTGTTSSPPAMEPSRESSASSDIDRSQQPMLRPTPSVSLVPPSARHRRRPPRVLRIFRSLCRTLPIFTAPKCKLLPAPCRLPAATIVLPASSKSSAFHHDSLHHRHHNRIVIGTLFGYRKGRISFSLQETSRCLPSLVVELAMHTHALIREMSSGLVRIALECEKKPPAEGRQQLKLLDEPMWTMFCNGKKAGYGIRREASEEDLAVMEMLKAVSMGAGVLPGKSGTEGAEGEMAYVRSGFEHVIGSRDSESFYMMNPNSGDIGPSFTIFFVRI